MKSSSQFLFIALITFFGNNLLWAQVAVGLKGGANFGNVYMTKTLDNLAPDFKSATGALAGGVVEANFGKYFALQSELNWVQKGFRFSEDINVPIGNLDIPAGVEATIRTNYLEIPLLAKAKIGNDVVQAYAVLGPSFGYAMNGKLITRTRFFFEFDPIRTNLNFNDLDYSRFEVSAVGGVGMQVNFNGGKWFADARYTQGLTQLYNFPVVNEQIKNRGVALSTGVMINLVDAPAKKKAPVRRAAVARRW
ncbi:MAG: PorT family protein [Saprospiraceae bacterium]|nr:PorT family protein [Saprospiraceae bacterium]